MSSRNNKKWSNPDNIYAYKTVVEQADAGLTLLILIFNDIYCMGKTPHAWLKFKLEYRKNPMGLPSYE